MSLIPESPEEILEKLLEKRARPDVGEYAEPRDEQEQAMCQLWAEVLRIDRVGRDDSILDLGDSFQMVIIASQIFERYGVEVRIADFFERPTVAKFVESLREDLGGAPIVSAG